MEKKYYELIVSLIKNHRKFIRYESILNDIVEDVYNHAKIVLDSVTNEDVILSYLKKIVDTSIITVPKKLNINTRIRHRSITIEKSAPVEQVVTAPETADIEIPQEVITETSIEPIVEEQIDEPIVLDEIEEDEEEINVDKTLVDKMINGSTDAELVTEDAQEDSEIFDSLTEQEEIELPEELEEDIQDELETTEEESFKLTEEIYEEEQVTLAEAEDDDFTPDLELSLETESESPVEETLTESNDIEEENNDLGLEEPLILDESFESELEEGLTDNPDELDEKIESAEFIQPNYECFNFIPEEKSYDADEIKTTFAEIETRHPEKQITRICNLKYSQNLSVAQIAQTVDMSEEDVLDILNEIIDIVKD